MLLEYHKKRNMFREYLKICNFVTYQITFLMTCQKQKTPKGHFEINQLEINCPLIQVQKIDT